MRLDMRSASTLFYTVNEAKLLGPNVYIVRETREYYYGITW